MSLDWLPGLDLTSGTFTLPLWAVGIAAALFVALVVIAVMRSGVTEFGSLIFRIAVIVLLVVFGWTYVSRTSERDRADERRALDQRAADLVGRAIVPGSAIACLEATNNESVEGACERAVFASPETVAAATAYLAARLSLLADAHDYVTRRDQGYESSLSGLRRTIAADRYGLASQVLAARDGCTADACDAFALVYDDKRLRANLKDRLFDVTIARYAVNWPTRTRPLASGPSSGATGVPAGPNVVFPSAASIPPVSIMSNEPPAPPPAPPPPSQAAAPAAAPPAPTNSAPASAPRRPAAKQPSGAPLPLGPPPAAKQ
jgi:membrane protein implicated in regulation of membrane protease activity